jgi:YVTN family beta-propeller protein
VTATVTVGNYPVGVAVHPDGSTVYVTNSEISNTVSVIDTATNTVTATVSVGSYPWGVAVNPSGSTVYVTNSYSTVSVIDTATNTVTATVPVGSDPRGVAVHPSGSTVYVANLGSNTVSVIDTATNTVIDTVQHRNRHRAGGECPYGLWAVYWSIARNPQWACHRQKYRQSH